MAGRRMCRAYLDRQVPRSLIRQVLDLARRTPSAGHAQGTRFAVVTCPESRAQVAQAYGEDGYRAKGFYPWLSLAPVHLVVASSQEAYRQRYREPDKSGGPENWPVPYPVLDAGQSLMALYLGCHEAGLACGYLGPHAGPNLVELLRLPSDWQYLGLVTIGYRDAARDRVSRSTQRGWRDLDEVAVWLE